MHRLLRLLLLALPVPAAAAGDGQPWPVGSMALPAAARALAEGPDGPFLKLEDASSWTVRWDGDSPILVPAIPPVRESAPGLIPDGEVARGAGVIRRAWFSDPTAEYGHAILGDAVEAKTLRVQTADGRQLSFTAPDGTVFEDLTPRLWDLDRDGEAEAWVIRAGPEEGARLEAYGVHDGALILRFATDPIGTGFRWLNPIGVADFIGDGLREVALVRTPHIGGLLILYRPAGAYLERFIAAPGFSNHAIGSRELGLHWVGDIDGDGFDDILLPGKSRREMAAFSLYGGEFRLIGVTERTGHIETSLAGLALPDGGRVILFADDGPALRWLRLPD